MPSLILCYLEFPQALKFSKLGPSHRKNAQNIDLNRNFPDQFRDPEWKTKRITSQKMAPETKSMIKWIENSNFILSLNLHGGSVVASYPVIFIFTFEFN